MFSKKFRLPSSISLRTPQHIQTPYFTLKIGKNDLSLNRYGFVVAKNVDKRATVRNAIKRRVRAYMEIHNMEFTQGNDFLFIMKKEILHVDTKSLWEKMEEILKKEHML